MIQAWLVAASVLAHAASAWAAVAVPREFSEFTGLSAAELAHLLQPRSAAAACPATANYSGVFSGPGVPSLADIVKRNSFVKRDGSRLKLAGEAFKPVMGGNAVRGHTLGVSFGTPLSVEPSLDKFNNAAYEAIDFAITAARLYGIKLMIPLVDNYNWYHGGKYQFIQWHGINFTGQGADITPPDVGAYFYNTSAIVDSFKRYITHHLNHVNQYTGVALKDDPTIFAWESGNELSGARFGDGPAPAAWTREIGEHVKSLAPRQLFMDGSYGVYPEILGNKVVDIFGDHFYPPDLARLKSGMQAVADAGRVYFAGEYDWTGLNGGANLPTFLHEIEASPGAGDFFWSLFGRDDACCQYVEHADGFSFYYLRGNESSVYVERGEILMAHAANMTGKRVLKSHPKVACPQKILGLL